MTASSEPDRLLAGRYLVGPVVGRGRSPVYRARDMQLGREVAVKQVGLPGGPEGGVGSTAGTTRARALREARAAACLSSPSVVQVYDVVEEASAVWLVMELVQAPTLAQLVHDRGPLDEPLAARIGLGVLDALEDAHAHGVVHRDVKPANVLVGGLDDSGPDVAVKLADFGVAVVRDEPSVTAPGTVIGSPWYLAPEQATGRPAGPPADLWALGALLYFAVEGRAPFAGDSVLAAAAAVVHGEPRPQARPGRLSRAIALLLDKRPDYRMGAEHARAVLRSIAGVEVVADDGLDTTVVDSTPAVASAGGAGEPVTGQPVAGEHARGAAPVVVAARPTGRRARAGRGRAAAIAAVAVLAVLGVTAFRASGGDGGGPAGREAHSGRDRADGAPAAAETDGAAEGASEERGPAATPPTTAAAAAPPEQTDPAAAEPPGTATTLPAGDEVTTTTGPPATTEPTSPPTTAPPDPSTTTTALPGASETSPAAAGA